MMDKYNIALNDKGAKVKILRKLLKDYKDHKDQVSISNYFWSLC